MREKTLQAIMSHAQRDYPREACGVICQKSRIERYFPCRNLADKPNEQFHLSPEDYAVAEEWGTIIGIVHSHPDATTQPSEQDRAQCDATELPWHIVSWPEGDFRTIQPRGELPLIGRPFVLGVYDCWGLVMSYYRQTHGIELPDYRVDHCWWENGGNLYMDNWYDCGFREFTGLPRAGDVAMIQFSAPVVNHAGVLLDGNMILHHKYGFLSQKEPHGGYWKDRTIKIVRYKTLL